jgi:MFS family permease
LIKNITGRINQSPLLYLILIFLSLAQLMIVLDFSIVNVALPSIQAQFHLTTTTLQWVVSAYALTFGSFLLLGGRASDYFKRKNVFLTGLVLFSLASLMGGLAPSAVIMFIARAFQGLGAAILAPSALSLLTTTFHEGNQRNWALGIFGSMAGNRIHDRRNPWWYTNSILLMALGFLCKRPLWYYNLYCSLSHHT